MKRKFFFLILTSLFFCSCVSLDYSANQLIQQSHNGKGKKALLFIKHGGATVRSSIQVSIMQADNSLTVNAARNVFIADDSIGTVEKDDVRLLWRHQDTLEVSYYKKLRLFKSEPQLMGITILYKEVQ